MVIEYADLLVVDITDVNFLVIGSNNGSRVIKFTSRASGLGKQSLEL